MQRPAFTNSEVEAVFNAYPQAVRKQLLVLRDSIFQVAQDTKEVGRLEETLKWGNPSYLTSQPKSGTTIRLAALSGSNLGAVSVHCQTTLVGEFKECYPQLNYDGNRSIVFDPNDELPLAELRHFIYLALTYHHRKKLGIGV